MLHLQTGRQALLQMSSRLRQGVSHAMHLKTPMCIK
jgi:hypothetical protein